MLHICQNQTIYILTINDLNTKEQPLAALFDWSSPIPEDRDSVLTLPQPALQILNVWELRFQVLWHSFGELAFAYTNRL